MKDLPNTVIIQILETTASFSLNLHASTLSDIANLRPSTTVNLLEMHIKFTPSHPNLQSTFLVNKNVTYKSTTLELYKL